MISVIIATKNFRFLYRLNEILTNIKEIKTNHILPNEPIPSNIDVVITTEIEKKIMKFEKIFVPKAFNTYYLFSNILLLYQNKKSFNEIIIGIDPGKTTGFAVVTETNIILNVAEFFTAADTVKEVIAVFFNVETTNLTIKIGAGGGSFKDEIIKRLEEIFHEKVSIQIVNEDFTSKTKPKYLESKFSKNIQSAILITSRKK